MVRNITLDTRSYWSLKFLLHMTLWPRCPPSGPRDWHVQRTIPSYKHHNLFRVSPQIIILIIICIKCSMYRIYLQSTTARESHIYKTNCWSVNDWTELMHGQHNWRSITKIHYSSHLNLLSCCAPHLATDKVHTVTREQSKNKWSLLQ